MDSIDEIWPSPMAFLAVCTECESLPELTVVFVSQSSSVSETRGSESEALRSTSSISTIEGDGLGERALGGSKLALLIGALLGDEAGVEFGLDVLDDGKGTGRIANTVRCMAKKKSVMLQITRNRTINSHSTSRNKIGRGWFPATKE